MDSLYTHITQSAVIQRQKVTLQKHAAGTKGHLFYYRDTFLLLFLGSVMYNNKQDFIPPLVNYKIVYLTNMESFLYFLNKAYGQLGYHSAQEL